MVYISKPETKSGISRKPGQRSTPTSKKPNKQQLQALEKEGRDNTRILQKALGAAPARPTGPPPDAIPSHNPLQRLAASIGAPEEYGYVQHQPAEGAVQYVSAQQQQAWLDASLAQEAPEAPSPAAAGPHNYMQRNCQRLGGQGVASLLSDASATQQPGSVKAGASDGFMSSLAALKPGLTDDQKAKAAAQREQLKRDLEEQMRAKREAEARRKQQLAEQEEREEAALRAYYARQAAEVAAEAGPAAGSSGGKPARGDGAEAARPAAAAAAAGAGGGRVVGMAPPGKKPGRGSLDGAPAQQAAPRSAMHSAEQPAARLLSAGLELPQQPTLAAPGPVVPHMPAPMLAPAKLPPAAYTPFLHPLALGQLGQLPAFASPFVMPTLLPTPPAPVPSSDNTASQTLATLLKELQAEQQRLRQQFEQQSDTVHLLQSDILLAQRERDAAQQQLQRVHSLLANSSVASHTPDSLEPSGDPGFNLDTLAITTVLPAGYIASRLSTPAGARGQQQRQPGAASAVAAGHATKAAAGMAGQQRAGGSRVAGPSSGTKVPRPAGASAAGKSTGKGSAVRGQPDKPSRGWM